MLQNRNINEEFDFLGGEELSEGKVALIHKF